MVISFFWCSRRKSDPKGEDFPIWPRCIFFKCVDEKPPASYAFWWKTSPKQLWGFNDFFSWLKKITRSLFISSTGSVKIRKKIPAAQLTCVEGSQPSEDLSFVFFWKWKLPYLLLGWLPSIQPNHPKILKDPLFFYGVVYIYIDTFMGPQKTFCLVIPISKSNSTKHHPKKGVLFCFLGWIALLKQWISMNSWTWRSFPKTCENLGPSKCFRFRVGLLLLSWVGWKPPGKTPPEDELTLGTWNWWILKIRISSSRGVFWGSMLIFQYTLED